MKLTKETLKELVRKELREWLPRGELENLPDPTGPGWEREAPSVGLEKVRDLSVSFHELQTLYDTWNPVTEEGIAYKNDLGGLLEKADASLAEK
jgi:hypothetical protein